MLSSGPTSGPERPSHGNVRKRNCPSEDALPGHQPDLRVTAVVAVDVVGVDVVVSRLESPPFQSPSVACRPTPSVLALLRGNVHYRP